MDRTQALDQTKTAVFLSGNAAFLGCILNHMDFSWDSTIESAQVEFHPGGAMLFKWNPEWFDGLSYKQRQFVLLHELWHIALMHGPRIGGRDPEQWNIACDIRINNDLIQDPELKFNKYDAPEGSCFSIKYKETGWTEELIYRDLKGMTSDSKSPNASQSNSAPSPQSWGTKELPSNPEQVQIVESAVTMARMAGKIPGSIEKLLSEFLKPKLPWKNILHNYLQDKLDSDWSWNRPNRRFSDIYLPSLQPDEGRLISVAMFLDVSGSIEEEDIKRFTTEVQYVHSEFKPNKLSVLQFDVKIQDEQTYTPDSSLKKFKLKGGGGTSLKCVHQWITKHKPTLAIIFTDLCCNPMEIVKGTNIIWIIKNNSDDANQGKSIHV